MRIIFLITDDGDRTFTNLFDIKNKSFIYKDIRIYSKSVYRNKKVPIICFPDLWFTLFVFMACQPLRVFNVEAILVEEQ